jgi:exonuclease III
LWHRNRWFMGLQKGGFRRSNAVKNHSTTSSNDKVRHKRPTAGHTWHSIGPKGGGEYQPGRWTNLVIFEGQILVRWGDLGAPLWVHSAGYGLGRPKGPRGEYQPDDLHSVEARAVLAQRPDRNPNLLIGRFWVLCVVTPGPLELPVSKGRCLDPVLGGSTKIHHSKVLLVESVVGDYRCEYGAGVWSGRVFRWRPPRSTIDGGPHQASVPIETQSVHDNPGEGQGRPYSGGELVGVWVRCYAGVCVCGCSDDGFGHSGSGGVCVRCNAGVCVGVFGGDGCGHSGDDGGGHGHSDPGHGGNRPSGGSEVTCKSGVYAKAYRTGGRPDWSARVGSGHGQQGRVNHLGSSRRVPHFGSSWVWQLRDQRRRTENRFDSTKGYPGEGPPRADIRVVTLNANSGSSAVRFIKNHGGEVDIFLLQETKVTLEVRGNGECPVEAFKDKLLRLGFKSAVAPGRVTDKGGKSGGVAIAWRGHLNITNPQVLLQHRAISVELHTHGAGDIHLVCVYGDVQGTWKAQKELWASVSRSAAKSGKPFIWGGDWNSEVREVQEVLCNMHIPGVTVSPDRASCVTASGGSVIDFFITHKKLSGWCKEAEVYKEGYSSPHRPVGMLIKGQQTVGLIEVHKRPPALKDPMGYGPYKMFDGRCAGIAHEVTKFMNEQGLVPGGANRSRRMTPEVSSRLSALFNLWYGWAAVELEQRFGFKHKPEQDIEVKKVDERSLLATHSAERPVPSAALRFMRDRLHEARGASWLNRSNKSRFKAISCGRISWMGSNLKGQYDEDLAAFKKCYRTRLGYAGKPAVGEQGLLDRVKTSLDKEVKTEWGLSRSDWVEFVENDLKKGGKSIHSITRLAEAPPIGEVVIDGIRRSDDQAMLQSEHLKWSKIWGMEEPADPDPWNQVEVDVEVPKPVDAKLVQGTARSFAWHTSNYEGLSPRHVAELPEVGLTVLAQLFNLCEVFGDYPDVLRNLFVKLIPKPTGGFRPICLFRSLYRIHMKSRSGFVRAWEAKVGSQVQGFNNEPGRRITDAMYRDGMRGDILGASGPSYHGVELLRDLAKAYEAVRRPGLWQVAGRHGYPCWLLRLSLNAYGWGRRLEMGSGMVGPKIQVPKGICAGSAHATYELKMYLLDYLCEATGRFNWLKVSIHVDDFSLFVKGQNDDECLVRLEEAANHMDDALCGLQMKQAKDKEEVLGTSDALACKAARMLKVSGGRVPNRAVKLGADYSIRLGGPARRVRQKARFAKFKARLSKATRMLDRSHRALAKVFVTGLVPGALYGAEISDFSRKDVATIRTGALRCANLNAGGVHNSIKWAVLGARFDPEVAIRVAPVLAFAREVWSNGMRWTKGYRCPSDNLDGTEIWKVQKAVMQFKEEKDLGADPGPNCTNIARLFRSLEYFGAVFTKVGHLRLRSGREADLSICSPRLLEDLLVSGKDTQFAEEAHMKVWGTAGEVDCEVLRRATRVAGHSRGFIAKVVAGAVYTLSKAVKFGTLEVEECPVCPGVSDTQAHRVLDCKRSHKEGDKQGRAAWSLLKDVSERSIPERACTVMKWPPPRLLPEFFEVTRKHGLVGAFFFHNGSPVYIDGSGMFGKHIEVRTAASAAVQKREGEDDEWDAVSWPVPDEIDQTSVVSEILALLMALKHMRAGLKYIVYADCMAVILGYNKSYCDLVGKGRHDGLWKQIYEAREGLDVEVRKTKAHRSRLQAVAEDDLENFEGNEAADHEAKKSANRYGHPPATCDEAESRQTAKRKGVAWTLATLKQAAIDLPEVPRRVSRAARCQRKTADWEGVGCLLFDSIGGGLICKMCFGKVANRSVKVVRCTGLNTAAKQVAKCGQSNGHDLWVGRQVGGSYGGSPLFICRGCGAYAAAQCKALKHKCARAWGGRRNGCNRFFAGKHPCLSKVLIEGQRPTTTADVDSGVRSCSRHTGIWGQASVGGAKRPLPSGEGRSSGEGSGAVGQPHKALRGAAGLGEAGQVGPLDPWDEWYGEVGRPPEGGGELEAWEVDEFFGPG